MRVNVTPVIPVVMAMTLMTACDQDPLGRRERALTGNYYLVRGEDQRRYYLYDRDDPGIGPLVLRVGWNSRYILADGYGGTSGVVIIDVRSHEVRGPFSDSELAENPDVADVELMSAELAWKSIPWKPPWTGA